VSSEIIDYYNQFDEWGRLDREPVEYIVNLHYIHKYLPENGVVLDNGAGPGKYSMELAKKGCRVTLTDLTPRLVEIAKQKAEELGVVNQFDGFHAADARDLHMIGSEQYDASLMLGPMYHLQKEEDRNRAVMELYRVTKKEGIVFVAFMPRTKHIFNSLISPESWKPNNNMENIKKFSQTGCFNHEDEGRFTGAYYYNMEDIHPFMEGHGFETMQLIGSNVGSVLSNDHWNYWREKGDEEMDKLIKLIIEKAVDPSIQGISSHLLYIGRKK
jgi:ubiquinone/menaquinone biosynthesis C-methylase UbiE